MSNRSLVRKILCQSDPWSERTLATAIPCQRNIPSERPPDTKSPCQREPLSERRLVRKICGRELLWERFLGPKSRPGGPKSPQLKPRRLPGGVAEAKVASKASRKPCPIDFWSILAPKMETKTEPRCHKIDVKSDNEFLIGF